MQLTENLHHQINELEAENVKLRSALGSIHAIATGLCRSHGWLPTDAERIRDLASEALATAGEGGDS